MAKNFDLNRLVRPNILRLAPYSTARDEYKGGEISVWVDANENPYQTDVNRYPDPHQKALKEAIAKLKGVAAEQIFVGGAGSDEAIDLIYRVFCIPGVDNVVAIAPSYGVYAVAADINDVEYRQVQLGEGYSLPVEALLGACDSHTKVMWVCSPNNPTANAFSLDEISALADRFNGILVVDEAYVDFSSKGSMLRRLERHPNLVVMQTFSKAWGMASLRLGMAFSSPAIAAYMAKVKYPYNVNGPTQQRVIAEMQRDIRPQVAELLDERRRLEEALAKAPGVVKIYPSDANFLLVKMQDANDTYSYLAANGVLPRNRCRIGGCEGCLRITVGTPEENSLIIKLMQQYGK